ncbi:hypothetical protein PHYPO_G00111330 [Pangasianodon hypophthalmus]|uniref:VIT domain-containing protein n=1 Tax=Pangasianodon hypophthalmus TaxID=310915 RepID=A0A5N5L270_PANHP|nr:hypothetical protein PHYPO_G00111330 [Pangasianodon hypophthalmus]
MERATIRLTLLSFLLICVISAPTKKSRDLDIYSFHINSTVISRYAITIITSRVANRVNESREVHFQVKIPKNAFISKFRMTTEGKTYDGVVKQKEEAQQQYSEAVSRGESAGLVGSVGRTLEEFKTSVTVAAFSKVTFELTYEELLKRRLGKYESMPNQCSLWQISRYFLPGSKWRFEISRAVQCCNQYSGLVYQRGMGELLPHSRAANKV